MSNYLTPTRPHQARQSVKSVGLPSPIAVSSISPSQPQIRLVGGHFDEEPSSVPSREDSCVAGPVAAAGEGQFIREGDVDKLIHSYMHLAAREDSIVARPPTSVGAKRLVRAVKTKDRLPTPIPTIQNKMSSQTAWRQHQKESSNRQVSLSVSSSNVIQRRLEEELLRAEVITSALHRQQGLTRDKQGINCAYRIDRHATISLSSIIRSQKLDITAATKFLRGETSSDPRPNKALDPGRLRRVLEGYPHLETLITIATHGIEARWSDGLTPRRPPPKHHGSCDKYIRGVTRSIREGQDSGQYMVVDASILELWPSVIVSPLGAVEKKGVDPHVEVRTIHDLSYPIGDSTNSCFLKESAPVIHYEYVAAIARRIEMLVKKYPRKRICMLKGDVKGAFRHLMTKSTQVHRMAAVVKSLNILIIDMAAPFGWAGSPPFYSAFGRAISWLMSNNSPATVSDSNDRDAFFGYEWVDDHILVEPDVEDRLSLAEATLRHAMLAVLGPRSINESKFTAWATEISALGLRWNTVHLTVSIPEDKIVKALHRVEHAIKRQAITKRELQQLLGSLRHVATCLRTAKPFYQSLQGQCSGMHRFGRASLSEGSIKDLVWFQHILTEGQLAELPISMFSNLPAADVELYMDASDTGLAVLDPAAKRFIQIKFDVEECAMISNCAGRGEFSINIREHLCMAFAVWTWGTNWQKASCNRLLHVKCWSDNISAVNWCNKLAAKNSMSQEVNRAIGLAEAVFNIRVSASHLPGSSNTMADAASRAWTEPYKSKWTNFCASWQQWTVPETSRKLYTTFSSHYKPSHWPTRHCQNTRARGGSGSSGAAGCNYQSGSQEIQTDIRTNLPFLQPTAGNTGGPSITAAILPPPYSPNSAMSLGIIDAPGDIASVFSLATSSPSLACDATTHRQTPSHQSTSQFSSVCTTTSTSETPATVSFGGLRSWASSFFCVGQSI